MGISNLSQLYWKGEYSRILAKISEKLSEQAIKEKERVFLLLFKARILAETGQLDPAYETLNSIEVKENEALSKKEKTKFGIEKKLVTMEILFREKNYQTLHEVITSVEEILKEQPENNYVLQAKAQVMLRKSTIALMEKKLEKAEEGLKDSLKLFEEIGDLRGMSKALNNLGLVYEKRNNFVEALNYYFKSLELKKQIGNKVDIARTLHNIGKTYVSTGEFTKALKFLEQSLSFKEEIGDLSSIALTLNEIGVIYLLRGELDSAEHIFKRILDIRRRQGEKRLAAPLLNLGFIQTFRNDYDKAREYYLQALEVARENNETSLLGTVYYNLIDLEIIEGNKKKAEKFLQELEDIWEKEKTSNLETDYFLAKAVVLKNNPRLIDKAEAQKIYLELANKRDLEISKKSEAIIYLCEILFEDYEAFNDSRILLEIEDWLDLLEKEARKQRSHELLANVLIIEAKLALLNNKLEVAEAFLSQAKALVEELGLLNLEISISLIYDELAERRLGEKDVEKLGKTGIQTITFKDLLKTSISRGKQAFNIVHETPIAFLIFNKKGRILYYKQLNKEDKELDLEKAFQGFILLILSSKDMFAMEKQNAGRMIIGSYVFLIKAVKETLFVYVIKGSSFSAIQKMDAIIESSKASLKLWNWLEQENPELKPEINIILSAIIREILGYEETEEKEEMFEISEEDTPKELLKFKNMFHPVKIAVLNVLAKNYRISMSDLRKILGIPWGNLQTHLSKMIQDKFIEKRTEFIDEKVKEILYITGHGIDTYNSLKTTLSSMLTP